MPERRGLDPRVIVRYASLLDFAKKPTTRAGWYLRIAVTVLSLLIVVRKTQALVAPLLRAPPPRAIPSEEIEDYRFKLPERTRREIFAEMAVAELAERKRAVTANTWNGHAWSREDDRGWYERVKLRELATRYHASLSQMYLVLDEGIRSKWPGPDGAPLPATTPPFNARTNSW